MKNGRQQRETKRDNARQLEIDEANRALIAVGAGGQPGLTLGRRISVALRALSNKISVHQLELEVQEGCLRGEITAALEGEAKAVGLLNAQIRVNADLEQDVEAQKMLLAASEKLAHDRGLIIQKLQKRIVGNYQDKSGALVAKDEEITVLREGVVSLSAQLNELRASYTATLNLLAERNIELAQIRASFEAAILLRDLKPEAPSEDQLGNVEIGG